MTYDVYLQAGDDDLIYAHVPSLMGCNWNAATPEEALARAPQAIAAHLAWLRRHGQAAPPEEEPILVRTAQQAEQSAREGALVYFLPTDREAVSAAEMQQLLGLMACARADLLALARHLPDQVLDREPAPGRWPIRQILQHVANGERWLLGRIVDPSQLPAVNTSLSVWQLLEAVRALAVKQLLGLDEAQRTAAVVTEGEMWSARKVCRRLIEHELEHCAHVLEVLEALGLPHP